MLFIKLNNCGGVICIIKAVIFDLDGTLLNRDASLKLFVEGQYERLYQSLNHIPRDKYIERFIEFDDRGYVWKDTVYQQIVAEFDIIHVTWEELLQDYITEFKDACVPFPNLNYMLEGLRNNNLVLGMITNGRGQFQMNNIKALGIEDYFETILISEWVGMKKPEPIIFQQALKELDVLPSESIFVGDHPLNDIIAANMVGMKTVWKKDNQWKNVKADYTIEDLQEISLIIGELNK